MPKSNNVILLQFDRNLSQIDAAIEYGNITGREPDLMIQPDAAFAGWFVGYASIEECKTWSDTRLARVHEKRS